MPAITCVFLNKVDQEDRPFAISFANFMYNLFGFIPSPIIYGMVNDLSGYKQSRLGMVVVMYSGSVLILFSVLAMLKNKVNNNRSLEESLLKK